MLRPTGTIVKSAALAPEIAAPDTVSGADPAAEFANLMVPVAGVPTGVVPKIRVPLAGRTSVADGGVGTGATVHAGAAGATLKAFNAVSVHVVCRFVKTTFTNKFC
ncbi:MAG TPA: hypothetical protein VEZ11_02345 [Thermoanaerobaculia bacterium]|nr:hypothetical protein [Thermoanaerobaculia bacterium]